MISHHAPLFSTDSHFLIHLNYLKMKKRLLYVGALLTTVLVNAQQLDPDTNRGKDSTKVEQLGEVVLTDSRFSLKRENSGKTIIKINAATLEKNQGQSVAQIINAQSGIEINGSRSNGGQNLSYIIRGGNNMQVLVLIDGIQVSDPSQVASDYDLRLLDVNQIESIEIVKGAASTLYGNAAATAVINITTKKASKEAISAVFTSSIGTNKSADDSNRNIADFNNSIAISGTSNKLSYNASFGHQYLDGTSAVADGTEHDAFSRTNAIAKIIYKATANFSIAAFVNHDRFTADFDNSFPIADADFSTTSKQYRVGVSPKLSYTNGSFTANVAYNNIKRDIRSSFPNKFESESFIVDAFNKYTFNSQFYTIVGVNYIDNETDFNENSSSNSVDPYANVVWVSDFGLNINAGARFNNHSEYGSNVIYNLNPSYTYKFETNYIKLLGSYSTSFIAPNLSQLFGPFGANLDLDPETNITLEAGAELKLADKLRISTVYFNRTEEGFIDFGADGYFNVTDDFILNGVEVELSATLIKNLQLNLNYTFTEKKDAVALRIPKHKANASLGYTFSEKTFVGLNYQYVDDRTDNDFATFPATPVVLESFSLIDVLFNTDIISNRLKLSVSVRNVLNEEYTEVLGFTTLGRNYRVGLKLDF